MPRLFAMSTIRTRCKRRADQENSTFIADAEWNALISEVFGELWSEVSACCQRYFETSDTVTATGAASYTEPSDHYSTIRIARVDASDREYALEPLRIQDEAAFKGLTGQARYWALVDDQLFLYPNPPSGTYKWYYLQQPTDLSEYVDADLVDVVTPDGEAFLIWGVAAIALAKSESNASLALAKQEAARERLQYWAANRNLVDGRSRAVEGDDAWPGRFGPDGWERW